jgi:hypothetical protein
VPTTETSFGRRARPFVLVEERMSEKIYDVTADWAKRAFVDQARYKDMYARSIKDPNTFWAEHGKRVDWIKPFTKVENVSYAPGNISIKWFEDGVLNVAHNCVDRHLAKRADQTAIIWEGDDPSESKHITYRELHDEVCKMANILRLRNVKKGDRVTIYMPMIPEAAYAMLACARIGAIHSVVFGGFSPDSLAGRIEDCKSNVIITADEGLRGGKKVPLKANVDAAIAKSGGVDHVIVVKRTGGKVDMNPVRDVWYHEAAAMVTSECPVEPMNAEDPLFILYTSGSTGKPKGVLHTTGGYLVYASMTHQYVFDYHEGDIYWCTADVGWVTGHSYILYGPLANGATTLMFEGVPNYPSNSRFWEVIDKHQVNTFYTAPTAIRALMQGGDAPVKKTSRKSLRLLGSVGEPINPEAWEWYYHVVGDSRCPIVEARLGDAAVLRRGAGDRRCGRQGAGRRLHRQSLHRQVVARPDAHGLRRSQALRGNLLLDLQEQVLHRRWLPPRRGRLLLDHRPRRRRDQRLGPPHGHGGSRKLSRRASTGVGSRRRRLPARHQGSGHLRLRHADDRRAAERGTAQGTDRVGAQGHRSDRLSRPDSVRAGPAENPFRQDHAPHSAQDRRGRSVESRRYVDAGRSGRGRRSGQQPPEQARQERLTRCRLHCPATPGNGVAK